MLTLLEPPSPVSFVHTRKDKVPPVGSSQAIPCLLDAPPTNAPPDACPERNLDTVEPSENIPVLKRWLQTRFKKSSKDPASHKPDRASKRSRRPAELQSRSQSPAGVNAANEGPSRMAAGQRVRVSAIP